MNPDSPEHESLPERALDLFVFAPAGLVVTALEELPHLVSRGRDYLTPHVRSAHAVGRFTVDFGSKSMSRKANELLSRRTGAEGPAPQPGAPPVGPRRVPSPQVAPEPAAPAAPAASAPISEAGGDEDAATTQATASPTGSVAPRRPASEGATGQRPTVDLAIPGYDSLSASQVVRRLDSLGPDELEAVERYEAASRGRRTILHRIHQIREEHGDTGTL